MRTVITEADPDVEEDMKGEKVDARAFKALIRAAIDLNSSRVKPTRSRAK